MSLVTYRYTDVNNNINNLKEDLKDLYEERYSVKNGKSFKLNLQFGYTIKK